MTRKGPLADLPNTRRVSDRAGGFGRDYNAAAGPREMERGGSRRGAEPAGDGKVRDFDNWARSGPLSPAPAAAPFREGGRVREGGPREPREPRERRDSPSWGAGRPDQGSQDGGSRPPRGEFREREREPSKAELDTTWRARMRPDAPVKSSTPTPEASVPTSPAQPPAPAMRPKLNLAKRTVSEAEPASAAASASSDSKASPFGAARPVDTTTREREVEEKLQLAIRQKKEADEKAREEKRAKEAAAKAAAAEKAEAEEAETPEAESKSNGAEAGPGTYKVMARGSNAEGDKEKNLEGAKEERSNGDTGDEKPVRGAGRGAGREPPRGPKQGGSSWRRKPSGPPGTSAPASPATPTAPVDEDGWSTVPAKGKGTRGRGGPPSTRAAAS